LRVTPQALEEFCWSLAVKYMALRQKVLAPIRPYIDFTGTDQPWRMFVAPHHFPPRYQVLVHTAEMRAGTWEKYFEERSDTYSWRENLFTQERMRSGVFRYSWPIYTPRARRMCEWIARQIFAENPQVTQVFCRYERVRSPSPEEAERGEHAQPT